MTKAEETRQTLLKEAFMLVYRKGFQATSIDDVLQQTQLTKGAFFYHFKNKEEMGLAMIREVMYPGMYTAMVTPLLQSNAPVQELYRMMKDLLMKNPMFDIHYGCPAVNLVEEMAPLNENFRRELGILADQWMAAIVQCLKKGKMAGLVRKEVHEQQVAVFIVSGYTGVRNMGKISGRPVYTTFLKELKRYLEGLQ